MGQEQVQVNADVWTHTYSGGRCYPLRPDHNNYKIEDIAHALSNICRYGGHSKYHYSVAQHSLAIAALCKDPTEKLYALLHDASEAYLGDIPRPLKSSGFYKEYKVVESAMSAAIFRQFGLDGEEPERVKYLDYNIVRNEAEHVFHTTPMWADEFDRVDADPALFRRTDPVVIERRFLDVFRGLLYEKASA